MLMRILLTLLALSCFSSIVRAERRVAFVVGNSRYESVQALANPAKDAAAVTNALRQLDFEVTTAIDLPKPQFESALRTFIIGANGADVAVFYYAGHAFQLNGHNFLVPVSAQIAVPEDIPLEALDVQDVIRAIELAKVGKQIVFLDACRNNPFPNFPASKLRGLARFSPTRNSLVVFSTDPDAVAYDGQGDLSPFAASLSKRILEPRAEVRRVVTRVRADVLNLTQSKQSPWDNSSLTGDFFFVPIRQPPIFNKVSVVSVSAADAARDYAPLKLQAPRQPEGGAVRVHILGGPQWGTLAITGKKVGPDTTLSTEDVPLLGYKRMAARSVGDAFSFEVVDAWGNSDTGFVSIAFDDHAQEPQEVAARGEALKLQATAVSVAGLGPNLTIPRTAFPEKTPDKNTWVRLASYVPNGELRLGDRKLEEGRSLQLSEIPQLTFLPAADAVGRTVEARFLAEAPATGDVLLQINVEADDCDRAAAAAWDMQGIPPGVLPGQLDPEPSKTACTASVGKYPQVGRFHFQLGRAYLGLGQAAEAEKEFQKAVELGHKRAHVGLSYLYRLGLVGGVKLQAARAELEAGVAAGDVTSEVGLAQMLMSASSNDGTADFPRARMLLENGIRIGHSYAMTAVGLLYVNGQGVQQDWSLARRYFEQAALRGDGRAALNLALIYEKGLGVGTDAKKAMDYLRTATELNNVEAPGNIGRYYLLGIGVAVDRAEGIRWLKEGIRRGDGLAGLNLASVFLAAGSSPVETQEGVIQLARAANAVDRAFSEQAKQRLATVDSAAKHATVRALGKGMTNKGAVGLDVREYKELRKDLQRESNLGSAELDSLLQRTTLIVYPRSKRLDLF